ncbi:MAG: diaminopimelate decarboxylase [Dehalococcoidia bacterium]|nr:diaminopimelate decarboxylase [Dehalococcoidia bacterium]
MPSKTLPIFPVTAAVNEQNHLVIGGMDVVDLAAQFGTPLYVFDDATLRRQCAAFTKEFSSRYPGARALYASKALSMRPLLRLIAEEGLGLDVVSGGELAIAKAAGFPMERIYFHGNNKSSAELRQAVEWRIGRIVVDNFHELALLNEIAGATGRRQEILLRISPGVDPHTHHHTTTGILDSKFGFAIASGDAERAVQQALHMPHLDLLGIHIHLGSPIYETDPYREGINVAFKFAAAMRDTYGLRLKEFSPGGGFPIQYTVDKPTPPLADYAETIAGAIKDCCATWEFEPPAVFVEPGRAIVGRAGVALYTAGARKEIPQVRTYVSVDGGMGDNIRPAIYGSRYEALVANHVKDTRRERITIAGKYCESGDVLIKDIELPPVAAGDLIAIPASGAYCIAMSSNYNASPKPAVVLVKDGKATLWARRETADDLLRREAV